MCYAIDFTKIEKYIRRSLVYSFIDSRAASHRKMIAISLLGSACETTQNCSVTIGENGNLAIKQRSGIPVQTNTTVTIFYDKQELRLLPPPYTTNCFDYGSVGIKNQDDCVLKCIKVESLKILNLSEEISEIRATFTKKYGIRYRKHNNTSFDDFQNSSFSQNFTTLPGYVPILSSEHYRVDVYNKIEHFPRLEICKSHCSRVPCKIEQFTTTSITQLTPPLYNRTNYAVFIVKLP